MQDVRFVDVDTEGTHLVLEDKDGTRYRLALDDELRAAVRGDLARLDVVRAASAGPLRPKEIQARIRAGMSAEDLAEAAKMPLAQVKPYERPVLAEREHVALRARGTALTRTASADVLLEDAVTERLLARQAEPGRLWDAWREESGAWVVQLVFTAGGRARRARWRFDVPAATLEPMDDEARWLSDAPAPRPPGAKVPKERVYDIEADGGVIETEGRAEGEQSEPSLSASPTLDLLEALRGRRGQRQPVGAEFAEDEVDLVDALLDGQEPPAAHPPASRPDLATDAEILALPKHVEPSPGQAPAGPGPQAPAAQRPTPNQAPRPAAAKAEQERPAERPERARPQGKGRKPAIPSWDDIVFGAKRD